MMMFSRYSTHMFQTQHVGTCWSTLLHLTLRNLPCRWMANSSWKDRSSFPATLGRENPSCQFTLGEYFPVNTHSWLKIHLFQLLWTTSINHSKSLSMRHPNQSEKNGWIFSKHSLFTSYYASFLLQTSQSPHLRRAPGPYGSAAALGVGIGLHQRSSPCFCWRGRFLLVV